MHFIECMASVAMSEEQQAVAEVQDVSPSGGKSPMGDSQIVKPLRPGPECLLPETGSRMTFASVVPLCVCCYYRSLVSGMA